jgi:hypothetical protein
MALGIRLGPDVYYPSVGSAALAVATDIADLRMNRWFPQVENGQLLELATIAADVFNVLPDGTPAGMLLDGARDFAVGTLVRSFTSSRLAPVPVAVAAPAPAAVQTSTPSAGAAAALQAGNQPSAGSAGAEQATAAY